MNHVKYRSTISIADNLFSFGLSSNLCFHHHAEFDFNFNPTRLSAETNNFIKFVELDILKCNFHL